MATRGSVSSKEGRLTGSYIELAIRLGFLALLLYWSLTLIQPFISIFIWSVVIAVALYPLYQWTVRKFGGRTRLAATLVTLLNLAILIGPSSPCSTRCW